MLHLRLTVGPELTPQVLDALSGHPGVVDVVAVAGACLQPPGDLVTADVVREAVDEVITDLRALGVDETGSISVEQPELVFSRAAQVAERAVPGSPVDSVVWQEVRRRTSEEANLSVTYLLYMTLAMLLAAIGIMTDSAILIVAAMVVGPDFGPTAATAVGVATRHWRVARRAFATLMIGFAVGIVATIAFTAVMAAFGWFTVEMVEGPRSETAFIYSPGVLSLVVAMIAGVVGMLALTTSKSGGLIGVFISVTTIPAAANVGVAIYYRDSEQAFGSLFQLLINIIGIQVAAGATLFIQRMVHRNRGHSLLLSTVESRR